MAKIGLIIAGGRDFADYDLLHTSIKEFLPNANDNDVVIISGMAKGADLLGLQIANEYGISTLQMPADWDKYGKAAGYRRNVDMADQATHLLAMWDGKSRGTMHMINIAEKKKLIIKVIHY